MRLLMFFFNFPYLVFTLIKDYPSKAFINDGDIVVVNCTSLERTLCFYIIDK